MGSGNSNDRTGGVADGKYLCPAHYYKYPRRAVVESIFADTVTEHQINCCICGDAIETTVEPREEVLDCSRIEPELSGSALQEWLDKETAEREARKLNSQRSSNA
jgi:hypothetical protein